MCLNISLPYAIVDGPGKWDLMLSLFDSTVSHPRPVSFRVSIKEPITENVVITQLGREDGSGESWIFEGYAIPEEGRNLAVRGWFSTHSRKGHIKYEN